ncbi:glycoside hydrolase family 3 domain protein [Stackebrandtia nassauensis DSM 44728]|uniref:Glycoside hydrolase family 3 domain protein n=2 Tax=Stackebrandtia TaxID=283810 RepID=D3PZF3_STANL|nr:glycoside hydrolase family 3 N-terminal domain-containing protein [Stackebrandtia nassauensis]ADD41627.1 glycoside hydrolase family 3 domain protein [Stackebrandtia nassauensis DSM 44728]
MPDRQELRQLALRTLIPGFSGTTAPRWALDLLDEGLGGYCLFAHNVADPQQLSELNSSLRQANKDVLIAIDEEGGDVTRLHSASGSHYPGNAALGAVDDPELTAAVHQSMGAELAAAGVTVDFAPSVDVNVEDDNPVIGTRSFGRDPQGVARHAVAAVRGLHRAGIIACAKHFPGHGATVVDSHFEVPTVDIPLSELRERELVPFRAVIDSGIELIMSGHIRVPELTGDAPGTMSRAAMHDLLRGELGFDGAIVTDAMEMRGASGAIGMPEAVVRAIAAGCDLICTGGELQKRGPMTEVVNAVADAVATAVIDGRLPYERLADAVRRGDVLREWQRENRGSRAPHALGLAAARRAITVEGTVPALSNPLIVQIDSTANIAVGESQWGVTPLLAKHLPHAQIRNVTPENASVAQISALADNRPVIVVARDTHRRPASKGFVEGLAASGHDVVLVEMGWPAAWRPEGVAAYVASFGAAAVNAEATVEVLLGS